MNIKCDKCRKELESLGGLLFSPPDYLNRTDKVHLCTNCYNIIMKWLYSNERNENNILKNAILKYKNAIQESNNCAEMILSSGETYEAKKLMKNLEDARNELFKIVKNYQLYDLRKNEN